MLCAEEEISLGTEITLLLPYLSFVVIVLVLQPTLIL